MVLKNSKLHRINKKHIKNANVIYLDSDTFSYNSNNLNKEEKLLLNIVNLIISQELFEKDKKITISDSGVENIYFEYNKNLGGITIPYYFVLNNQELIIKNEGKIKNKISKINIIVDNTVKTINLNENFSKIVIGNNRVVENEMCIELFNDKKEIEYYVDNNGNIEENLTKYYVTQNDLVNGNLDLRKLSKYKEVKNNKVNEIDTIIIDAKTIKKRNLIKSFIPYFDDRPYYPGKYMTTINSIQIIDENDMRLMPREYTYSLKGYCNADIIDGFYYIYLPNEGNDTLIYLDKYNKIKMIEKKDILEDKEVEDVYFKFGYKRGSLLEPKRKISLILIKYKNGNHKIINFDETYYIDKIFNKIILDNLDVEDLFLTPPIIEALKENNWSQIMNEYRFDNDKLSIMNKVYNEYYELLIELKNKGLRDRTIEYLCDKNYIKPLLENFKNTIGTDEILSKEIETFNNLGEEYHKLILKNNRG